MFSGCVSRKQSDLLERPSIIFNLGKKSTRVTSAKFVDVILIFIMYQAIYPSLLRRIVEYM